MVIHKAFTAIIYRTTDGFAVLQVHNNNAGTRCLVSSLLLFLDILCDSDNLIEKSLYYSRYLKCSSQENKCALT